MAPVLFFSFFLSFITPRSFFYVFLMSSLSFFFSLFFVSSIQAVLYFPGQIMCMFPSRAALLFFLSYVYRCHNSEGCNIVLSFFFFVEGLFPWFVFPVLSFFFPSLLFGVSICYLCLLFFCFHSGAGFCGKKRKRLHEGCSSGREGSHCAVETAFSFARFIFIFVLSARSPLLFICACTYLNVTSLFFFLEAERKKNGARNTLLFFFL